MFGLRLNVVSKRGFSTRGTFPRERRRAPLERREPLLAHALRDGRDLGVLRDILCLPAEDFLARLNPQQGLERAVRA